MSDGSDETATMRIRLAEIADALGCSVEAFAANAPLPSQIAETRELLRLWDAIDSAKDRAWVLTFMREIAGMRLS